jgi:hypothetical protein
MYRHKKYGKQGNIMPPKEHNNSSNTVQWNQYGCLEKPTNTLSFPLSSAMKGFSWEHYTL